MFHIPHQPTCQWVIQRGVWHIDDCLLFVLPWISEDSFKIPEISTLPVWITLKNILDCCYCRLGISHVASGLGEPILTHKPRLDPTNMGEAKMLVEMELDRDFPKLIALDDKQGSIFLVKVDYTWIPSTCERCGSLGHKAKMCLMSSKPLENSILSEKSVDMSADIPVVDIDLILQPKENVDPTSSTLQQKDVTYSGSIPTTSACGLQANPESEVNKTTHDVPCLHSDLVAAPQLPYIYKLASMEGHNTQDTRNTTISPNLQVQETNEIALPVLAKSITISKSPICSYFSTYYGNFSIKHYQQRGSKSFNANNLARFDKGWERDKTPIKYQDLEWKTVQVKDKHGRCGRGITR
ncbi:hypothetical protein N665_1585s0002 [Sinapis alba]|nr:hypothetical protein N665_1585s0002 [Sinapis alba]